MKEEELVGRTKLNTAQMKGEVHRARLLEMIPKATDIYQETFE